MDIQEPASAAARPGPLQPISAMGTDLVDFEKVLQNAERFAAALERMRHVALASTSITDWRDENGKPYLQWTGSAKVARCFGVSYDMASLRIDEIPFNDRHGEGIRVRVIGEISWNGGSVVEIGLASTRDELFGIRTNRDTGERVYLPLSEIDICDVSRKAITNWLNRGVKSILGMSYTWAEIAQMTNGKITRDAVLGLGQNTQYGKGTRGGDAVSKEGTGKRIEIEMWFMEVFAGNKDAVAAQLKEMTSFTGADGKPVEGKTELRVLSERQIAYLYPKVKEMHDKFVAMNQQQQQKNTGDTAGKK